MDRLRCLADEAAAANLGNFANWADTEPPLYIYIHTVGGLMAKPNRERERGGDVSQVHTVCQGETGRDRRQVEMFRREIWRL
jgi:hypothetical protein